MRFLTIWEILIRVDLNQAVKHIFKLRDCVLILWVAYNLQKFYENSEGSDLAESMHRLI